MIRIALILALAASSFRSGPQDGTDWPGRVARLESRDDDEARRAAQDFLDVRGEAEADAAFDALVAGWDEVADDLRLRRAAVAARIAPTARAPEVGARLDDPDARVRAEWLRFLDRADHAGRALEPRIAALARVARVDADASLRRAAREALGELDREGAVAALADMVRTLPGPEAAHAAAQIAPTPRGRDVVRELVQRGLTAEGPGGRSRADAAAALPDAVVAALLPAYGQLLADAPEGGEAARDAAPLLAALRHPAAAVRRAAARALDRLLDRLVDLGESERALRVLDELGRAGLEPRQVQLQRARLSLSLAADVDAALASARALRAGLSVQRAGASLALATRGDVADAQRWLHRSLYLEALALLAAGDVEGAREDVARATDVLEAALAEGAELAGGEEGDEGDEGEAWDYAQRLEDRALLEVVGILVELAGGAAPDDPAVLERARLAHRLTLEIQARAARLAGDALLGWDLLLERDLSPYRVLFASQALPGLGLDRAIELQRELGRVLATVAPAEMPGFVPVPGVGEELGDPLLDPRRRPLYEEVQLARLEGVSERVDEVNARIARRGGSGWVLPESALEELQRLDFRRRILQMEILGGAEERERGLAEQRMPGAQALWLARDLRSEGRGDEARQLARRFKADLERNGISNWWYYLGVERLVRADLLIGSSYTDDDEPLRAEEALRAAAERLEGLERRLEENGASAADLRPFRALRSNVLVSLAVNANVKKGAPDEALEYYEEAYALRQDAFMRVLLACYRARSGRADEARELLRDVRPGPQTWYNLACTHALLGESEKALEYLRLELEENHPSEASRGRQREWARGDPDLATLRGDPRFEALVGG